MELFETLTSILKEMNENGIYDKVIKMNENYMKNKLDQKDQKSNKFSKEKLNLKKLKKLFPNKQTIQEPEEEVVVRSKIGLDALTVNNLFIKSIDFEMLRDTEAKVYTENSHLPWCVRTTIDASTGELVDFSNITIEDSDNPYFSSLVISAVAQNGILVDYEKLNLKVNRGDGLFNYVPYTIEEYRSALEGARDYLIAYYGITIDMSEAEIQEMEINTNIQLPEGEKFTDYHPVFQYLTENVSGRFSTKTFKSQNKAFTGYSMYNKSMEIKIYDKQAQMKKLHNVDVPETIRVEVGILNGTSHGKQTIEKVFGTSKIYKITQDQIEEYFTKTLQTKLFSPARKEYDRATKKIKRMAKKASLRDFLAGVYMKEKQEQRLSFILAEQLEGTSLENLIEALPSKIKTAREKLDLLLLNLRVNF